MWFDLVGCLLLLAAPGIALTWISFTAATYYALTCMALLAAVFLVGFIASRYDARIEKRYIDRYQREAGEFQTGGDFRCLLDIHSDSATPIREYFFVDIETFDETHVRIGIVLCVHTNQHTGTEIQYWCKGRRYSCPAWGEADTAGQGRFIRVTYLEQHVSELGKIELPIKIEIEDHPAEVSGKKPLRHTPEG